jgi:hypothetical protein
MAKFDSSLSDFWLDNTSGTPVDLTAYLTDVSGLPGPRNLNEITALGDSGSKFHPGLQNATPSISGHYDTTASTGPDVMLGALRTHTGALSLEYYPAGKTSGYPSYTAECWVTDYTISSTVGSHVTFTASLQVDGVVTKGTVA